MFTLMLVGIEAASYLGYASHIVLSEPVHRPEYFECRGCRKIDLADPSMPAGPNALFGWDLYDADLGWDSYRDGKRAGPAGLVRPCASVFGDSFAHADEVSDREAWPFLLSERLGCEVENFGVGGYGLDQAYLKYLKYRPRGELVIVVLSQEMLRRNFAASWRFYASIPNALPKPFFRLLDGTLKLEKSPAELNSESIRAHHVHDRYAKPFVVEFPYSIALARVLYYRIVKTAYAQNRIEPFETVWTDPDAVGLSSAIVQNFVTAASADGKRVALVPLPSPEHVATGRAPYRDFVAGLERPNPNLCIIDPFAALLAKHQSVGALRAPDGHFNKDGNQAIASAIFNAIRVDDASVRKAICDLPGFPEAHRTAGSVH